MFAEQTLLVRCRHRSDLDAEKFERKLVVLRKREAAEQYMPGERSLALARRVDTWLDVCGAPKPF